MKKSVVYFISLLMLLFAVSVLFISCNSTKPIIEKTLVVEKNQRFIDSLRELLVNKAIADKLKIKVPKSNTGDANIDSIVNVAVNDILSKLNFNKTSGDNSFEMLYDALKRELTVNAKVGETSSDKTRVKDKEINDKKIDALKEVPIKVPYTQLEKTLMVLGLLVVLFFMYKGVVFFRNKFSIVKKVIDIV